MSRETHEGACECTRVYETPAVESFDEAEFLSDTVCALISGDICGD